MGTRFATQTISLTLDSTKHDVARACRLVWSEAMETNAMEMTRYFPNYEEHSEFVQMVRRDMENTAYHWYCLMYVVLLILIDISDMLL